jgi:hypothetical protein
MSVPLEMAGGEGADKIEGGAAVLVQAKVSVHIEVTGTQVLTGTVDGITAEDTETGFPLRINIHFQNTGNVIASPAVSVSVFQDQTLVDEYTFSDASVKPGSKEVIPLEWNTEGQRAGEYEARVVVSLGGETIATEDVPFEVLPAGTLTREGQLVSVAPEGEPILGTILKVIATFANTGQIETPAQFVGEVYRDGTLVDTLESQELLVLPKQRTSLAAYVKIEEPGAYSIKGQVNFGGNVTGMEEVSLNVAAPEVAPGDSGAPEAGPAKPGATVPGVPWLRSREALLLIAGAAFLVLVGMVANSVVSRRGRVDRIS